jgi:hypothetical protein
MSELIPRAGDEIALQLATRALPLVRPRVRKERPRTRRGLDYSYQVMYPSFCPTLLTDRRCRFMRLS